MKATGAYHSLGAVRDERVYREMSMKLQNGVGITEKWKNKNTSSSVPYNCLTDIYKCQPNCLLLNGKAMTL